MENKKRVIENVCFFSGWFILSMGIHMQVIPLDMTVADCWFYFPIVGMLGMLAVGYVAIRDVVEVRYKNHRMISIFGYILVVSIIIMLSVRTIVRNTNWKDKRTLLIHDMSVSDDFSKEDMLALDFLSEQKFGPALYHMEKSVLLNPVSLNVNNLGLIYQMTGNTQKAEQMYLRSLKFHDDSNSLFAYINISYLYVYNGRPQKALPIIQNIILPTYPSNPQFWELLAVAYYKTGDAKNAISAIDHAYLLSQSVDIQNVYSIIHGHQSEDLLQLKSASYLDYIPKT